MVRALLTGGLLLLLEASSTPLPLASVPDAAAFLAALDITVTVQGGGKGKSDGSSGGQPGVNLRGVSVSIDFDSSSPTGTGTLSPPMRTLNVAAGSFKSSIPVAGTLKDGATFRVVVDSHVVEIFGGATPVSFSYSPSAAQAEVAALTVSGGGTGPFDFEFDVQARQVQAAKVH